MDSLYQTLYEDGLPLKLVGIVVGLALIISHLYALLRPEKVQAWLVKFPRNETLGVVLVVIGFAWTLFVWTNMDLGEFFKAERIVQLLLVAGCIGVIVYVKEFLAVRATGFLMILAAAPLLEAAFLKDPTSRLLLVLFAYVIALKGMFWVGMPYLMRDQIRWVLAKASRYRIGAIAGLAYGAAIAVCAILWW
jgi:hypothetical protein